MSPVIVADDGFPRDRVAVHFLAASAAIDPEITRLVYNTIQRYPWRIEEAEYVV
jgi:hypothetical protein